MVKEIVVGGQFLDPEGKFDRICWKTLCELLGETKRRGSGQG